MPITYTNDYKTAKRLFDRGQKIKVWHNHGKVKNRRYSNSLSAIKSFVTGGVILNRWNGNTNVFIPKNKLDTFELII